MNWRLVGFVLSLIGFLLSLTPDFRETRGAATRKATGVTRAAADVSR